MKAAARLAVAGFAGSSVLVAFGVGLVEGSHHTTTRTPVACTRAALAAAQAQADWLTIDNAHNIADQAALNHATYRQYRRLLLDIPARPKIVDLAVCK